MNHPARDDPRVLRPRSIPHPRLRLFCFSHAGGGSAPYGRWCQAVPADVEVCPVQLPGREDRLSRVAFRRMEDLVARLAAVLDAHLDRPFVFFGHSMGALVAFEAARRLRRLGRPLPRRLIVAARRAPHLSDPEAPLANLSDAALVSEVQRRFRGVPPAVLHDPALLALLLPVLRADLELLESYRFVPDRPLECPLTALRGADDESTAEGMGEWGEHVAGGFEERVLPGDHFFVHKGLDWIGPTIGRFLSEPGA